MLRFLSPPVRTAAGLTRREWLRLGLGLTALAVPGRLPANRPTNGFGRAKSVLVVYTSGGMSQLESWDPKPDAPEEVRGAFGSIPTAVPGVRFGEHLPRVARLADRFTVVRTVAHDDLDHGSATYLTLTGRPHPQKSSNPPPRPSDFPTYAALLKRVRPAARLPHTAVHVNGPVLVPLVPSPGQDGGFLGHAVEPLVLGDVRNEPLMRGGLEPQPDLPPVRREARQSLLRSLEAHANALGTDRDRLDRDRLYRQAYELLDSSRGRLAFDLDREPAGLRDRYGRDRGGQACLLGRRLVEAGIPLVTVFLNHSIRGQDKSPDDPESYGWDTHNDIFAAMKTYLLPRFDRTFSALLEDLEQRGLLESTLVICMGEFGRAPRVALERNFAGSSPGRKHWAGVYSVVLAGAGVARGGVLGASDRHAGAPATAPVGPWDVAATLFHALGIDPGSHYEDAAGRPYPLTTGQPILGVYG
jgi:hypothetical protein